MPKSKKQDKKLEPKLMLVIRVRGAPHMNYKIDDTLKMLRLHKPNHGVLVYADESIAGMLKKIKDYVAYGEVDQTILLRLLKNRGLLKGNKALTDDHINNKTEYKNIQELSDALMQGKVKLNDVYNVKPVFRLHPPKGGYRGSIKKPYNAGGTLGNVGSYINILASKMI